MSDVIAVHGIGKHQSGRNQLLTSWRPAFLDGIERAAGPLDRTPALDLAYYGDLFLDRGDRATKSGATDPAAVDVDDEFAAEACASIAEVVTEEELASADRATKGYTRVPRPLAVAMAALDRRFGFAASVLHLGVLKQVRDYFRDPELKSEVDARLDAAVGAGCALLIGHSLGSVVAYEWFRRHPDADAALLTLGSPLGLRMVRDRLPGQAAPRSWTAVRDARDPVACAGPLRTWWDRVGDELVDNGSDAHAAERYLGKKATGSAVVDSVRWTP